MTANQNIRNRLVKNAGMDESLSELKVLNGIIDGCH
jgi:hypothetical protein